MNTLQFNSAINEGAAQIATRLNLKEIETNGFLVIRNFLNAEELTFLKKDYYESKGRAQNSNYPITYMGPDIFPRLREKIMAICEEVGEATTTHVDAEQGGVYFSVKKGVNFPWHQDHESYYTNQNHIDYLNFYMIVIKEKKEEANLNVIPFQRLRETSPEFYHKLVGKGAISYTVRDGYTHIHCDEPDEDIGTLPYDIGDLAETPHLNEGDLLLLRGDSIHSTQASDCARVALSIRMTNYQNRINLKRMVNGNKFKMVMLTNNRETFNKIFNAFKQLKVNEASYYDLITKFQNDNSPTPSKFRFITRVIALRMKLMFS